MYETRPNETKCEIHDPGGQSRCAVDSLFTDYVLNAVAEATDREGCTSEESVDYVLDIIAEVSFCIFLPGMGQIGKGGTRVRLGIGVLEHQRWTGFSRRSLLGYLHNYRSGIFQNREDWCIWLGHFTLQFVWHSGPGLWCGRGERGIIPHRSFEQCPVHIWLDNSTTTQGMRSAMGSECSYDRGLFDGSIGGFLFEKSSEFVVERLTEISY
ncbi:uncharacterized protein BDCG_16372 [Blastomyces dermatitidis ER-3]|uniref:Uncharacterized protein n=1 Tax=Ajellomyces dermatitidis (strain ER-3 / ATCC MYA-2586) TaxID=559297 RepID=A0ABX2VRN0_AJEDR|nr:uncharacterized protein BDCG_16372 [Blastomyces dermatitidis ER-3]OAS99886.1 hypothetical protein BDCG_16372 [Blastomyces dermatitidis ER-3]